jgi:multicomponent Na+:H+ antiporter subunit D
VYALRDIDAARERLGYHPSSTVLLAGINGAFLTADLFNLYVWFEVMLISSSCLLTLGHPRVALPPIVYQGLGWIAVATMIVGVLGAAYHWDLRRILAFHIVSQIGYMLLGIALDTELAAIGTVFYILHHIVVKANLFLIAGLVFALGGSWDLRRVGGLWKVYPWLGALFLVPALSLVGIPPLSGFWAKLLVVREALLTGETLWAVAALAVGFLTLYSMLKIWNHAFWAPHPDPEWVAPRLTAGPAWFVTIALATATLVIGLAPQLLFELAARAVAAIGGLP